MTCIHYPNKKAGSLDPAFLLGGLWIVTKQEAIRPLCFVPLQVSRFRLSGSVFLFSVGRFWLRLERGASTLCKVVVLFPCGVFLVIQCVLTRA